MPVGVAKEKAVPPKKRAFEERAWFHAFSRWTCLWRVLKRYLQNRNKTRESIAEGCIEKVDLEFIWWVLYAGRTPQKRKKYQEIVERYRDKVIVLKNQRQLDGFLENASVHLGVKAEA